MASVALSAAQQAPPAAPQQGRGRSPYQEAGQLPARIMEFKAEPVSIKPGESTTLTWAVENPRTTTIEQVERVITGELEFVAGELRPSAEARAVAASGVVDASTAPPG